MSPPTRVQFLRGFSPFIDGFIEKQEPFRKLKAIGGLMSPPYEGVADHDALGW